jgi:putative ABC transport system ATP-binding protein
MNEKETVIVCKNIRKIYGEGANKVEALRGIDLEISQGELRLLMGPSGSGKTTLVSVIAGILTQDSGECLVYNTDLNHLPDKEKTRFRASHIGFVFQIFNLIPMLTNEENISIPLILNGMKKSESIERSKAIMGELGLGDKVGMYPTQLSGGQQQRIAIGRALVHNPPLVVCDEPTSFLDHETGHKIMELLRQMIDKRKVTIIVVTHDPRIMSFADRIDQIEDGAIKHS